jgi:hypothetical protein
MKRAIWVVLLVAGCAGPQLGESGLTSGDGARDMATGEHVPKTPPVGTGGGPTAAGCNGVTEKGRCEISDKGQIAVVCDVSANKLRQFDCTAMNRVCVLDSTRGASCVALPPPVTPGNSDGGVPAPRDMAQPPPPPPTPRDMAQQQPPPPRDMALPPAPRDMATAPVDMAHAPMCVSGVDYRGYCASKTGNGTPDTAIWCDPSTGQTLVVDCGARGQTCQVDGCADGAYCCDAPTPPDMAQPPAMDEACATLGYEGECAAGVARWCSGGRLFEIDCGGRGQSCAIDECAQGAYCCDATTPPPDPTPSECDRLGVAGECAGDVARWCSGGQIIEMDCAATGQACQVDTCASGAYCCSG